MAHTIELNEQDKSLIIKALVASLEDKLAHVIRDTAKAQHARDQYESAGAKILKPVTCGRTGITARDNLFGWIIDQIDHSPNVKNTQLGERAINVARAAGRNQYGRYSSLTETNFDQLFRS